MTYAPICLFTYKRLNETQKTIEALKRNHLASMSELFIFSDGPKDGHDMIKVQEVRDYLRTITGFKKITITEKEVNNGLANSIIRGVSEVIKKYGTVIVMEDDLITSSNFLDFMNQALFQYKEIDEVQSVNGFSLKIKPRSNDDIFFHSRTYSWGWATWEKYWDEKIFDKCEVANKLTGSKLQEFGKTCGLDAPKMLIDSLESRNDSWYARWMFSHFERNNLAVYPYISKIKNVGFSNEATHCKTIDIFSSVFDKKEDVSFSFKENLIINEKESKSFLYYFTPKYKIAFRIKLLKSKSGIRLLKEDISLKFIKQFRLILKV